MPIAVEYSPLALVSAPLAKEYLPLRENRHFSVDEIGSKNGVLVGNMFAETVELKTMTSVAQQIQSGTILIIEDNDELRSFITELFDGRFYILEAESGERGVGACK